MRRTFRVPLLVLLSVTMASVAMATPTEEEIASRVEALLAEMTLDELAGQLTQAAGLPGMDAESAVREGAGSVLWLNDVDGINAMQRIATEETRLGIPLLIAFDVIHGYRTVFPVGLALAATWDPATVEEAQRIAAREARAHGIHWTFAPMVDIARDARWGRMVEGPGEDPFLGAAMAAAQVRGFQGDLPGSPGHLIACAKHFAGYGAAEGGRDYDPAYLPETQLRNVHLAPFRAAVEAGVGSLMSAYMDLNDVPAAANPFLLRDVLRRDWGFDGFVVSDWSSVGNLVVQGFARDGVDATSRAIEAGLNIDMKSGTYRKHLVEAVESGRLSRDQVEAMVRPVLAAKVRLGLFENPWVDADAAAASVEDPAHRTHARRVAARSMVLLKNEGGALPLSRDVASIAVIGPVADSSIDLEGSWTVFSYEPAAVTVLEGIRGAVGPEVEVTFAPGPQIQRDIPSIFALFNPLLRKEPQPPDVAQAAFDRAVATAAAADTVVVVLGETSQMSGEAASRASLDLPGRQLELLQAIVELGKPVVLVLVNGRPLTISWAAEKVPAILEAWQPGSEGGHAIADVLFGNVNPGGKLPVTFPRTSSHAPLYYARVLTHEPEGSPEYKSRYWDGPPTPLYPFGHGLSYTTFEYSDLTVEPNRIEPGESATVAVDVTNTGARAGDEVVQLYLHQQWGSDSRPRRELRGFERVHLAPGETRRVQFPVGPDELRYWSTAHRGWIQDRSRFDLWVGGSSEADLHAVLAVGVEAIPPSGTPTEAIVTSAGPVVGTLDEGVRSFLGIPYAAPPVGELRWRAPQPPSPWPGARKADRYAPDCMQKPFPGDAAPLQTSPAEDCLYLNVWAPESSEGETPVIVWVHGGGFVNGGTSPAVYDGSTFARRGITFVSMNYRLGRFGFFAHPALAEESPDGPRGNYGFLDQIAALEWVRDNIRAFGGDPENVTLFGESAGGGSVNTLMVSPRARGLFHRAIVQSGGGRAGGILGMRPLDGGPRSAEALGLEFARRAGVQGSGPAALRALRDLPPERIVHEMNLLAVQPETYSGPMIDGTIVPSEVEPSFRSGKQARIPYIVGANDREFGFSPMPREQAEALFAAFGDLRDDALAAYDSDGTGDLGEMGVQLTSDQSMVEPARLLARLLAPRQPTWSYRFGYVAELLRSSQPGALHATEIPFVFGTVPARYSDEATPADLALSAMLNAYWASFARDGDPNVEGLPEWPRYSTDQDVLLWIGNEGIEAIPDPRSERLDMVETLATGDPDAE